MTTAGCNAETESQSSGPLTTLTNTHDASSSADETAGSKPIEALSPTTMAAASKSLYLQGIRALIKYVPQYFQSKHINSTVEKLLECSKGTSSYEQVHAAERALENMAESEAIDPEQCMEALSKHFLTASTADENAAAVTLLTLRALTKLIGRIPSQDIAKAIPGLKPTLFASLNGGGVDMRKAAIFLIVEMQSRLGDEVMQELEGLTASQEKLVQIYIDRRKNKV